MKESMESSRSGSRILSRSRCKRSCSRLRNRSGSKLQGVHFYRPQQQLDIQQKKSHQKALQTNGQSIDKENEPRRSNSNRKSQKKDSQDGKPIKRQLSKDFFDRLTQFSQIQDRLKQSSDTLFTINNPLTGSLEIGPSSKYIKNIVKRTNGLTEVDTNLCISSKKIARTISQHGLAVDSINSVPSQNFITRMSPPLEQAEPIPNLHHQTHKATQKKQLYYVSRVIDAFHNNPGSQQDHLCRNHLLACLKQFQGSLQIIKPTGLQSNRKLPPSRKLNTIVFDLDETLLHCNERTDMPHDILLPFVFPTGQHVKMGINIRPYAKQCLKQLSEYFQLIVFTASHECYGQVVTDYLDPQRKYISQKYFRDSCQKTSHGYVKDLRVIDRSLNNMLLIDNAAFSYCFQAENGVPIIPFYDYKEDRELRHLTEYLLSMKDCRDIRSRHCQNLKTNQYLWFNNPQDLLSQLYPEQL